MEQIYIPIKADVTDLKEDFHINLVYVEGLHAVCLEDFMV